MRALSTFLIAIATFATARADTQKPNVQLDAVRSLIGGWTGKGAMTAEGKTHQLAATYDCTESAGGAGVKCRCVITGIPNFTYMFDDLWGVSPQDGLTHWYVVTNAGEVHDHRGHFDMNGGLLQIEVPVDGKLFSEVIAFKRKGKTLVMSWTSTSGGTLREKGELTLQPKTK
jgi:hypothetical protein